MAKVLTAKLHKAKRLQTSIKDTCSKAALAFVSGDFDSVDVEYGLGQGWNPLAYAFSLLPSSAGPRSIPPTSMF